MKFSAGTFYALHTYVVYLFLRYITYNSQWYPTLPYPTLPMEMGFKSVHVSLSTGGLLLGYSTSYNRSDIQLTSFVIATFVNSSIYLKNRFRCRSMSLYHIMLCTAMPSYVCTYLCEVFALDSAINWQTMLFRRGGKGHRSSTSKVCNSWQLLMHCHTHTGHKPSSPVLQKYLLMVNPYDGYTAAHYAAASGR